MSSSKIDQHRTGLKVFYPNGIVRIEYANSDSTGALNQANAESAIISVLKEIQGTGDLIGNAKLKCTFDDGVLTGIEVDDVTAIYWRVISAGGFAGAYGRPFLFVAYATDDIPLYPHMIQWGYEPQITDVSI